jgi:hypothetical protein
MLKQRGFQANCQFSRTAELCLLQTDPKGETPMNMHIHTKNGDKIAVIHSEEVIITDGQSALDLIAEVCFGHDCRKLALNKSAVSEDFFRLSTGLAGEVIQKFVNYSIEFAVIGDLSGYTSKPLQDFIRESNNGRHMFFVGSAEAAVEKLSGK